MATTVLLGGPLVCEAQEPTRPAAVVLLPRSTTAQQDDIQRLSLAILPLPMTSHRRHERDATVAAQHDPTANDASGWHLTYSVPERRLRWHLQGCTERASTVTPSSCYAEAAAAHPRGAAALASSVLSCSVTISSVEPVLPFALAHVSLEFNRTTHEVTLRVTGASSSVARCQLSESAKEVFLRSPLYLGGPPTTQRQIASSFVGLIAEVTMSNSAQPSDPLLGQLSLLQHLASSVALSESPVLAFPIPHPTRAEPIHSWDQLLAWQPGSDPHQVTSLPHPLKRSSTGSTPGPRRRVLHCHDMAGGFTEDFDTQHGLPQCHAYAFQMWAFVDIFVYFSHARIVVPPTMWVTAAHRNGAQILGCICTEWTEGAKDNIRLLDGLAHDAPTTRDDGLAGWQRYARQLVALAVEHHIDGWFINIEARLPNDQGDVSSTITPEMTPPRPSYVVKMIAFLSYLTTLMHEARPGSLVIWYDSLCASDGAVRWQSELNHENLCFAEAVDGFFTDYHWDEGAPYRSALAAGDRRADVFTGIDLHGRGSWGGGGLDAVNALRVIRDAQTSVALFAPAWTYEGEGRREAGRDHFLRCERQLWLGAEPWRQVPFFNGEATSADKAANFHSWELQEDASDSDGGWSVCTRDLVADTYCFVTSRKSCTRSQTIDLLQQGFTTEELDRQPDIRIRAEYAVRSPGVADQYTLCVALLGADQKELARFTASNRFGGTNLQSLEYTFSQYGKGLRFLRWQDSGKDASTDSVGPVGTRIGASSLQVRAADQRPESIADFVDRQYLPLHAFVHSFNTGNGRHFFLGGERVSASARPTTLLANESRPWFNLGLQDCQTILTPDLLCDGIIAPIHSNAATFLHAQARISHDAAFDGGSCFEMEARLTSNNPRSRASLQFECFEFGPSDAQALPTDWFVRFVYSRPSTEWAVALQLQLDDANGAIITLVDPAAADGLAGGWRTVRCSLPADSLLGASVRRIRVELRYQPSVTGEAPRPGVSTIRLGQVCVSRASPSGSPPPPTSLRVTRHLCLAGLMSESGVSTHHWEWGASASPFGDPISWDVFVDAEWRARVLIPRYTADLPLAKAPGVFFSVRANYSCGDTSASTDLHAPWHDELASASSTL